MTAQLSQHPTPEQLAAFGLGKLSLADAAAIADHLDGCSACRKAVDGVAADSFAGLLSKVPSPSDATGSAASVVSQGPPPLPSNVPSPADTAAPSGKLPPQAETRPPGATSFPQAPGGPPPGLPAELAAHPKFRILGELGRGGMGVVYKAEHRLMERLVAIKVINQRLLDRPEALERFRREVKAAAKLSHPNIVTAYDAEQAGDLHLLVMELVEGLSLAQFLQRKGTLPVGQACDFVGQALQGLQHAFQKGMVHRDLKPQNLMLTAKGVVKILDFGLARLARERDREGGLTQENATMGTPDYMAPEQAMDAHQADIRADVYSLGCTLYCLLCGQPPFPEGTAMNKILAHMRQEPRPVRELRPDVPAGLTEVVARMMAKDPAKRPQTPAEVALALQPFGKGRSADGGAASPPVAVAFPVPDLKRTEDADRKAQTQPPRLPPALPRPAANPWEGIGDPANAPTAPSHDHGPASPARGKTGRMVGILALALGLLAAACAAGVMIFRVKTAEGVVVLEIDQPGAEVFVDGNKINVIVPGDDKPIEIKTEPGKHKLRISKEGFVAVAKEIEFQTGKSEPIKVRLERGKGAEAKPSPAAEQFQPLFNSKDMTGWIKRDGRPADWAVRDGYMEVTPGKGDIMTRETFGPDFKLHAEFWLPLMPDAKGQGRANSGIFLQGRYEVQVLDSFMNDTFADGSIGALYGLIAPDAEALQKAIRPPEQWQTYDITFHAPRFDALGTVTEKGRITIVLNGVTVINEGRFSSSSKMGLDANLDAHGPILLQDHGAFVRFRKIEIKELPPEKAGNKGWTSLFNGKDLSGWKTHADQPGGWTVEDGCLVGRSATASHLFSERDDYENFQLRAEVQINKYGNSGIYFRSDFGVNRWGRFPTAYEAQILHSYPKPNFPLTGSLSGFSNVVKPLVQPDEWFTMDVIAKGNHIVIKINGEVTVDFVDKENTYRKGRFALQAMSDDTVKTTTVVKFRKIEIKELPPASSDK
jgi:serine/threonine protein kinase